MPKTDDPAGQKLKKTAIRQGRIADLVIAQGQITAQELAEIFDVSVMTVHRDLDELEKQGVLRKARGGVTAQPNGVFESRVGYRMNAAIEAKRAIASAALAHIESGMSLLLDDSTTALEMIPGLAEFSSLHVATNFLAGLKALTAIPDVRVIAIGGEYDPLHDSFQGLQAIEAIQGIRADALFMSTSAVSATDSFHQEDRIVAFKRAMIESATERYLLVDSTKLNRKAFHLLAPLSAFTVLITDSGIDDETLAAFAAADVTVEVAR